MRKHMHRRMANQLLAMGNEFYVEIGTPILEFIPPLHPVPLSMVTANAHLLKFFPKRCIIRLLLKKSILYLGLKNEPESFKRTKNAMLNWRILLTKGSLEEFSCYNR